ncbi:hypothetical protein EC957_007339 [Mortierella hygrophila]|uniref:HMG box domain-containing protein n=1 Tax=Mortierella hygrophila TaxID=979708 RepID=A0A9P6FD51_9FUNG|nr:hypothetical protein EC957_007339 [Mortierella hygrophila]
MSTATNSPKGKNSTAPSTTTATNNNASSTGNGSNAADTTSGKANTQAATADDIKYKRKYKDLKKRIRDIEDTDQTGHPSPSSSSTSDSDTDNDRNGGGSRPHRHLNRHKHHRHPYSSSASHHHSRQTSSHSLAPPSSSHTTSRNAVRSKTPPSRGSSVIGSVHHSASSSLGGNIDPSQSVHLSPSGKKAVKKRRKDPLAPKRPSNAFFIFSQQHRQQAREEKKEGNQSELTKFLGLQWKSMPTTEKKIYSELAIQDRQRYLDEMSQYQHEHKPAQNGPDDSSPAKKKPGKPGRPPKAAKAMTTLASATTKATSGTNGPSAKSKMGIQAMVNDDQEGDDLTSPDEEDDVRMDGSEEDHEDEDDDEDEDEELEHDNEPEHEQEEDEEEEEEGESHDEMEDDHEGKTNGHHVATNGVGHAHVDGGYGDDVDMVDAHRAHPGASHSLVVSA